MHVNAYLQFQLEIQELKNHSISLSIALNGITNHMPSGYPYFSTFWKGGLILWIHGSFGLDQGEAYG
jgi:hypothetical protein